MNQELFTILLRKNSKATEKKFLSTCAGSRIIKKHPSISIFNLFNFYFLFTKFALRQVGIQ